MRATTTAVSTAGATTTSTAAGKVESTAVAAGTSALRRRDVPPEGVAAQLAPPLAAIQAPHKGCRSDPSAALAVEPSTSELAVGDATSVCLHGFSDDPVELKVRLPDGPVRKLPQPQFGVSTLAVAVLDPLGAYAITATQGQRSATASVSVALPERPVIETLDPTAAPPGTTFRFGVASPGPGQSVELDLYAARRYRTTLAPGHTDGSGRLLYQLPTLPDDPLGTYCIVTRPQGHCAEFRLT